MKKRSKEYQNRIRPPEYHSWNAMVQRCHNPKHRSFKDYGGRGISVCERWKGNFRNFLDDMGERPEGHTLDRIDPEKDYSKENCCWSDYEIQNNNKRCFRERDTGISAIREELFETYGLNI